MTRFFTHLLPITAAIVLIILTNDAIGEEIEMILGFHADERRIVFHVRTGGCTEKKHFRVKLRSLPPRDAVSLTLFRLRKDDCKGYFPEGKYIVFSREELGLRETTIISLGNGNAAP